MSTEPGVAEPSTEFQAKLPDFRVITLGSLLGLTLGFGLGTVAYELDVEALAGLSNVLQPIATAWTNALRMTIVPLVVSFIIVAVASTDSKTIGRLGGRTVVLFVLMLLAAGVFTMALGYPLLTRLSVSPEMLEALRVTASTLPPEDLSASGPPAGIGEWLVGLFPPNPIRAAADDQYLPLIVFTVLFGLAITRIPEASRERLVGFFRATSQASMVLVSWVLYGIPVAAFAISYPLAQRVGIEALGPVLFYIVTVVALMVCFTLLLYPFSALAGRVRMVRFARAVLPAQAVAIGTRSSLASLPALMDGAERHLEMPERVRDFALPLSVATFKVNRTITTTYKLMFLAALYGIAAPAGYVFTLMLTALMISFSSPGIPSGGKLITLPFYLAIGLPLEGVILLRAVDAIPDIFKTLVNVTADMSVATVVARADSPPVSSELAPAVDPARA